MWLILQMYGRKAYTLNISASVSVQLLTCDINFFSRSVKFISFDIIDSLEEYISFFIQDNDRFRKILLCTFLDNFIFLLMFYTFNYFYI